jgi:hypothetical protein
LRLALHKDSRAIAFFTRLYSGYLPLNENLSRRLSFGMGSLSLLADNDSGEYWPGDYSEKCSGPLGITCCLEAINIASWQRRKLKWETLLRLRDKT